LHEKEGLSISLQCLDALPTVFVSYSHKDEAWKKILLPQLEVLVQEGLFEVWEDRRIDAGTAGIPRSERLWRRRTRPSA